MKGNETARFFGEVQGSRGAVHRLGSLVSGLNVTAASWSGSVCVDLFVENEVDMAHVKLSPWKVVGFPRPFTVDQLVNFVMKIKEKEND